VPAGSAVYLNGVQVVPFDDQAEWTYTVDLQLGDNALNFTYRDRNNQISEANIIKFSRINQLEVPVVNSFPATTTVNKLVLTGTKPVGSGIWLNGQLIVAVSDDTTWKYEVTLIKGTNNFTITAKDGQGGGSSDITVSIVKTDVPASSVISDEEKLTTKVDTKLAAKLAGKFLLQVERSGLIWYVYPVSDKRYLITQDGALDIFRNLALGITEANLNLIPTKGSKVKGSTILINKLKGKLLLRTGAGGQISYVDLDGYRHDISAANLMDNFRSLSLGISNLNLRKLLVGEIVKK